VFGPDNGSLHVATKDSVTRYDASGTFIKSLWTLPDSGDIPLDDIGSLAVKDKGTLILCMGSAVHIIEYSSSTSSQTKIVQTPPTHPEPDPVHALSLSHDSHSSLCECHRRAQPRAWHLDYVVWATGARRGVHVPRPLTRGLALGNKSQIGDIRHYAPVLSLAHCLYRRWHGGRCRGCGL